MDNRKKAQMMNDLADLNSAAGTGKVWSEQDVQEFMNEWNDPREETLLEFLKE